MILPDCQAGHERQSQLGDQSVEVDLPDGSDGEGMRSRDVRGEKGLEDALERHPLHGEVCRVHFGIDTSGKLIASEYLTVKQVFVRIAQTDGEREFLEIHRHRSVTICSKLKVDCGDLGCYELHRR